MNNKRARQLRKEVYGKEFSPRARSYKITFRGVIVADEKRREYQQLKKEYKNE
ncbi:MAG: hypothetical protein WC942_11975 [Clostridia bacterium]|jgi:hypothetical protein